jgi:transposase
VVQVAAAAAQVEEVGSAVEVEQAAAHRRDPVAGTGGCAGAGRAGLPRLLTGGVRAVSPVQQAGIWQQIVTGLQTRADVAALITWDVSVDSTIARAHQHAAGARRGPARQKEPAGGTMLEPADHALERSRGGLTTKVHLACEQGQKPLSLLLTAGQRGDSPQFVAVLEGIRVPRPEGGRPRITPDRVLADKAYTSKANRAYLRRRGIKATIPSKADQDANRSAKGSAGGRCRACGGPSRTPVRSCATCRRPATLCSTTWSRWGARPSATPSRTPRGDVRAGG